MDSLIASLNINQIPAIGFVNEKKLFDKNGTHIHFQVGMLKSWRNSGHDLGTHTFSYPNYNKVSYAEYTDEIITPEYIITMAK
jgi:peptidoglycan/xylan/chitin deacetylase (PgdA/CDA1 family)